MPLNGRLNKLQAVSRGNCSTTELVLKSLIGLMLLLLGTSVTASDVYVPPSLEEWKDWVLADHPDIQCPVDDASARRLSCIWISSLSVSTRADNSIKFAIQGVAYAPGELTLPHGDVLPHTVRLNDEVASVGTRGRNQVPVLYLPTGSFDVTGTLSPDRLPRSINVPKIAAIVQLELNGLQIDRPRIENGKLWLQEQASEDSRRDSLSIEVFRKLVDDIPQSIETRIHLIVDGNNRVISLGNPLPSGISSVSVRSTLPIQVKKSGEYLVQVSRGEHWLTILGIGSEILNEFGLVEGGDGWPSSEVWVVESVPQHRTVEVEGVEAIDPSMVESPFGKASTYLVQSGERLRLTNEMRGDPNPRSPRFKMYRDFWLAFDGQSFAVTDGIQVDTSSEVRLTANYDIGNAFVDGNPKVITYLDHASQSQPGITLHANEQEVTALSRLTDQRDFSAPGWQINVDLLVLRLNLPPGWKLLWTVGVDQVNESWLSSWWNLWDIFFCVLIVVVVFRLGGTTPAGLVTVALMFSYQEFSYPALGWFVLALILLLNRATNSEKYRRWQKTAFWMVLLPVALVSIYVASINLRQAVYPQLETPTHPIDRAARHERVSTDPDVEELIVSGSFASRSNFDLPTPVHVQELDEENQDSTSEASRTYAVQTGPAFPAWRWNEISLDWVGPVSADQRFSLTLLPPYLTRVLFVVIAVLHLLILGWFVYFARD